MVGGPPGQEADGGVVEVRGGGGGQEGAGEAVVADGHGAGGTVRGRRGRRLRDGDPGAPDLSRDPITRDHTPSHLESSGKPHERQAKNYGSPRGERHWVAQGAWVPSRALVASSVAVCVGNKAIRAIEWMGAGGGRMCGWRRRQTVRKICVKNAENVGKCGKMRLCGNMLYCAVCHPRSKHYTGLFTPSSNITSPHLEA